MELSDVLASAKVYFSCPGEVVEPRLVAYRMSRKPGTRYSGSSGLVLAALCCACSAPKWIRCLMACIVCRIQSSNYWYLSYVHTIYLSYLINLGIVSCLILWYEWACVLVKQSIQGNIEKWPSLGRHDANGIVNV